MFKKLLLFSVLIIFVFSANAQQYGIKNLLGRWRHRWPKYTTDIAFINDSTLAYVSVDGVILRDVAYRVKPVDGLLYFEQALKKHGKPGSYLGSYIKFLNDSTFLFAKRKSLLTKADTTDSKVLVYKYVNEAGKKNNIHFAGLSDLKGDWIQSFGNRHIAFVDESHAFFKSEDGLTQNVVYKVDYTQNPLRILFTYADTGKQALGLLAFEVGAKIMFELFPVDSKVDDFTIFGGRRTYSRKPLLNQ